MAPTAKRPFRYRNMPCPYCGQMTAHTTTWKQLPGGKEVEIGTCEHCKMTIPV